MDKEEHACEAAAERLRVAAPAAWRDLAAETAGPMVDALLARRDNDNDDDDDDPRCAAAAQVVFDAIGRHLPTETLLRCIVALEDGGDGVPRDARRSACWAAVLAVPGCAGRALQSCVSALALPGPSWPPPAEDERLLADTCTAALHRAAALVSCLAARPESGPGPPTTGPLVLALARVAALVEAGPLLRSVAATAETVLVGLAPLAPQQQDDAAQSTIGTVVRAHGAPILEWARHALLGDAASSAPSADRAALVWLATRLVHPAVDDWAGVLLPVALRACDAVGTPVKAAGIALLHHCVRHMDASRLQWHGDVIAQTLRALLAFREDVLLRRTLPCAIDATRALDPDPLAPRPQALVDVIIREMQLAQGRAMRRLYSAHLSRLVSALGLGLVPRLTEFVDVLVDQLSYPHLEVIAGAVACVRALCERCWPRVPHHQSELFQAVARGYMTARACVADGAVADPAVLDAAVDVLVAIRWCAQHHASTDGQPRDYVGEFDQLLAGAQGIPLLAPMVAQVREQLSVS